MYPDNETVFTLIFSKRRVYVFTHKRYERDYLKTLSIFKYKKKNSKTCQRRRG